MLRRLVFMVLIAIGLAMPVAAQVKDTDAQKIEDVRHLIKILGIEKSQQEIMDQMMAALKQSLIPGSIQDERTRKMTDRLFDLMTEEMKKMNLSDVMVDLYAKHFTSDEIRELIGFYESPIGQKIVQVLPAVTQESMRQGMELGKAAAAKAMERWLNEYPELKKQMQRPAAL